MWIVTEGKGSRIIHDKSSEKFPEWGLNGEVGHVGRSCRVAPAFEEDVLERLGGSPITGAHFNFVSNVEAMSVMSNGRVGCQTTYHLGSERD